MRAARNGTVSMMVRKSRIRTSDLALAVVLLTSGGCIQAPLCPEGELAATLIIEDGVIRASGLAYQGVEDLGTLRDPHPGLGECVEIGGLRFLGDITTLAPFDNLQALGELETERGVAEDDGLTGFPHLRSIGSIGIQGRLTDPVLFEALEEVGYVGVGGNAPFVAPELTQAGAIWSGGALHTIHAPKLQELPGGLVHIGAGLTSLEGLSGLTYVGRRLQLRGMTVERLGLNSVTTIDGDLQISGNQALSEWGLDSVGTIAGSVSVGSNPRLPSEVVRAWVENVVVDGEVRICLNLATEENPDDCPD